MATSVVAATWVQSGSLHTVRINASAALLPNGLVLVAGGSNDSGAMKSAELYDPVSGTFAITGSMITARQGATATVLANGSVLIAGGADSSGSLASAEIYNVTNGTFTATGAMVGARSGATATLLGDGRLLVVGGGSGGSSIGTAELYDPATGQFHSTGSLQTTRLAATATLLPDGRVLVAGGHIAGFFSVSTPVVEIYDPATGAFTAAAAMSVARESATAVLLANGRVLIVGGISEGVAQTTIAASAESYNPVTNAWAITGLLAQARYGANAVLLPHGDVLVIGGYGVIGAGGFLASTEIYNAASGTFSSAGSMLSAREYANAVLLPDARVLVVGGVNSSGYLTKAEIYDGTSGTFAATGSVSTLCNAPIATPLPDGRILLIGCDNLSTAAGPGQIYDPATGSFATTAAPYYSRYGGSATLLGNGQILIAGGLNGQGTAEQYDAVAGVFNFVGAPHQDRYGGTTTLLPNGTVLFAGGIDFYIDNTPLQNAEIYDPGTRQFQRVPSGMQSGRWAATATLLANGKVLIAGGATDFNPGTPIAKADIYDPATQAFTITGPLGSPRAAATATLLPNGKVLIAGGYIKTGVSATTATAELYDPATGHFAATGSMASERQNATALLLPNGKVMIVGGINNAYQVLASAEIYDPATGIFSAAGTMTTPREYTSAALLADGRPLIVGGYFNDSTYDVLKSAEVYDRGLGIDNTRRPRIDQIAITAPSQPLVLNITGSGFRASTRQASGSVLGSEAASGGAASAATNYPIVVLQRIDNEQQFFLRSDPAQAWSDTSFSSVILSGMPQGFYRATVIVNAVPSKSRLVAIAPPSKVTVMHGDPQSTQVNTQFAQILQAVVSDANGNPIQGAIVSFSCSPASNGACIVNAVPVTSDAQGLVSTLVTANTKAGTYMVQASINGNALATFHLSNMPGSVANLSKSGSPQSTQVNTAFASALQVIASDTFGNPVPGAVVNFSVPGSGANAILTGNPATTNVSGVATVTALANIVAGSYLVNAATAALTTPFSLTNLAGPATRIVAQNGPDFIGIAGAALVPPPSAQVTDTFNNPVAGVSVMFATVGSNSGSISAENPITGSNGNAAVGSWILAADPGTNTLQASAVGLSGSPVQFTASGSPSVDIAVVLTNNRSFVQYGHALDYVIVVTAAGPSNAHNIQVTDLLPPQLDAASVHWVCIPAVGATCASSGNGNLVNQAADVPSGSSVTFVLSATVLNSQSIAINEITNTASITTVGDINTNNNAATAHTQAVIFRNAFEAGGDGAQ
ncbi:kelch repeat-containing protein [Pseudolysobacter antarcticus]|nr:kelch repeat-containing protein [Pseudolysobacter antarcticus]